MKSFIRTLDLLRKPNSNHGVTESRRFSIIFLCVSVSQWFKKVITRATPVTYARGPLLLVLLLAACGEAVTEVVIVEPTLTQSPLPATETVTATVLVPTQTEELILQPPPQPRNSRTSASRLWTACRRSTSLPARSTWAGSTSAPRRTNSPPARSRSTPTGWTSWR
jgi:hypothetical protein